MTADVIELQFGKPAENKGNGAREALIGAAIAKGVRPEKAGDFVDWVLGEMYMRGFKVVPL